MQFTRALTQYLDHCRATAIYLADCNSYAVYGVASSRLGSRFPRIPFGRANRNPYNESIRMDKIDKRMSAGPFRYRIPAYI